MKVEPLYKELRQLGIDAKVDRELVCETNYYAVILFNSQDDLNLWKLMSVFNECWDIILRVQKHG